MKRRSRIGAILGAVAIALAIAGFTLSTVDAQTGSPPAPVQKTDGQGVASASLGL